MTTRLQDVIIPDVWVPYMLQRTMELTAFIQSGVMATDAEFSRLASGEGTSANIPFFNDLEGTPEPIIEDEDLTAQKITTNKDLAPIQRWANMWAATDLSAQLAGADPSAAIAELVAAYWARQQQRRTLDILEGVFNSPTMKDLQHDISTESGIDTLISADSMIDANQLMGDAKTVLTAIAMPSITESFLRKQDLIEYIKPSEGGIPIPFYQGKRVIVDDALTGADGVHTAYIFGAGAVAYGQGNPMRHTPVELDRDKRKGSGVDYLINRQVFVNHIRGVKWKGVQAHNSTPLLSELKTGANWERVYEKKALRVVQFKHRVSVA